MEGKENLVFVCDGFVNTILGQIPNMVFMDVNELALKYSCLNMLLTELQSFLYQDEEKYSEAIEELNSLKTEMKESLKQYNIN